MKTSSSRADWAARSAAAAAPGKLILSGEHAVVHGGPALVTAVSRYATVRVEPRGEPGVVFETPFGTGAYRPGELVALLAGARKRHRAFLDARIPVTEVVPTPLEFVALAWPLVSGAPDGVTVRLSTDIPVGAGMGSSAAVAAACVLALAHSGRGRADPGTGLAATEEMERFQHGRPSGVDAHIAVFGGAVTFRRGQEPGPFPSPPSSLRLVHTGSPAATTGECVDAVRKSAEGDRGLWDAFESVCVRMRDALADQDRDRLVEAVRENHRLLTRIGVVPPPVADWISRVEERGGAAKVCGAGSIRGDAAGIVWVVGEMPGPTPYTTLDVKGEPDGVRIVE